MLTDRSVLIQQKLAKMSKFKNFKWDIFDHFQTMWARSSCSSGSCSANLKWLFGWGSFLINWSIFEHSSNALLHSVWNFKDSPQNSQKYLNIQNWKPFKVKSYVALEFLRRSAKMWEILNFPTSVPHHRVFLASLMK